MSVIDMEKVRGMYDTQLARTRGRLAEAQAAAEESREVLAAARRMHDHNTKMLSTLAAEVKRLEKDIEREFTNSSR